MVDDIKLPGKGKRADSRESDDSEDEPRFTPPEVIAEEEELIDMAVGNEKPGKTAGSTKKDKKPTHRKNPLAGVIAWWKRMGKKQRIIVVIAAVLALGLLGAGAYALFKSNPPPAPVAKEEVKETPPPPTTEPSKLTGVEVPIATNKLPITGIMIENSPDARPQAGLTSAGVVFEAIAEGGITRFLTLFLENQPDYVGPIRSVRAYYVQWARGFDAPIAHVGGSSDALAKIRDEGLPDLDQFANAGYFHRVSNRYAPHNVYTSLAKLLELSTKKGYTSAGLISLARKAEAPAATPTAKTINLSISSPLYNVSYAYDPATNSYARSQAGVAHTDERSGQQIKPKVVVALVLTKGVAADRIHTTYGTIGSGTVFIFQDGTVTQGTWTKSSEKDQFKFTDSAGAPVGLNPGQTWISIVSLASSVTYTP